MKGRGREKVLPFYAAKIRHLFLAISAFVRLCPKTTNNVRLCPNYSADFLANIKKFSYLCKVKKQNTNNQPRPPQHHYQKSSPLWGDRGGPGRDSLFPPCSPNTSLPSTTSPPRRPTPQRVAFVAGSTKAPASVRHWQRPAIRVSSITSPRVRWSSSVSTSASHDAPPHGHRRARARRSAYNAWRVAANHCPKSLYPGGNVTSSTWGSICLTCSRS